MTSAGAQTPPSKRPDNNRNVTGARTRAHSSNGSDVSPRDHGNQEYSLKGSGAFPAGGGNVHGLVHLGAKSGCAVSQHGRFRTPRSLSGGFVLAVAKRGTGQVAGVQHPRGHLGSRGVSYHL